MESLPYELIYIIRSYLLRLKDIANFSMVSMTLYNSISEEHLRILNIRKKYANINKSILAIKYYISSYAPMILREESLRINHNRAILYRNNMYEYVISPMQKYGEYKYAHFIACSNVTIAIWSSLKYISVHNERLNLNDYWINNFYSEYKKEIYEILNERNIKLA